MLDARCRSLLRGEDEFAARRAPKRAARSRALAAAAEDLSPADAALFEALRACRAELARTHEIPPYMVFHDATLKAMAELRPADEGALLDISGVGAAKLERFGAAFLETISEAGA